MNGRSIIRRETIVVPVKPLIPRIGVIYTRRETPKKGVFVRHARHRARESSEVQ